MTECTRCTQLGRELAAATASVAARDRAMSAQSIDLENAEVALRVERRKVSTLKGQLRAVAGTDPAMADVREVFEIWRRLTGHTRAKLGPKRQQAIASILKSESVDYVRIAIYGAVYDAYVNPKTGERHDDIELICRNEVNVEKFHKRGLKRMKPSQRADLHPFIAALIALTSTAGEPEGDLTAWRFPCPLCSSGWPTGTTYDPEFRPLFVRADGENALCSWCWARKPEIEAFFADTPLQPLFLVPDPPAQEDEREKAA